MSTAQLTPITYHAYFDRPDNSGRLFQDDKYYDIY